MSERWRLYEVTVSPTWRRGETWTELMSGPSRGRVIADAWRRITECWEVSFKDFLGMVRCHVYTDTPPTDCYDYVRRNYGVEVKVDDRVRLKNEGSNLNGREGIVIYPGRSTAHVHVVLDGAKNHSIVHPLSVSVIHSPAVRTIEGRR